MLMGSHCSIIFLWSWTWLTPTAQVVSWSHQKWQVSFAAQVLTNTVSKAFWRHYTSGEADETARFWSMINSFFDCPNVRSTVGFLRKRNNFIAPYRSSDDVRFSWLENTFVKYLEDWKAAVDSREGVCTADEKGRSLQTFDGLRMSVRSLVQLTKFLLSGQKGSSLSWQKDSAKMI